MSLANKIRSLSEVVAEVPDGAHIFMSGFTTSRNAVAVSHELIRQQKKDLTLSATIVAMDADLLVGAGCVKKYIYAGGSLDRFGPAHNINRARTFQSIDVEEWSGLSMAMRFLGGSLGLPCIPIQSLLGSDILRDLKKRDPSPVSESECPFSGEKLVMMSTVRPDYAFIHVQKADCEGNAVFYGPTWDVDGAKAAQHIIIVADEIIPTELTPSLVSAVRIPNCLVDAVVHQPFGAYPTSLYGSYDYDKAGLDEYIAAAATPEGMQAYLDKYVYGVKDFDEFLELQGGLKRMIALKADPLKMY